MSDKTGWHMIHQGEKVQEYFTTNCSVVGCDKPLMLDKLAEFRALSWDFFVELPMCTFHLGFVTASADILTPADDESA